MSFKSWFGLRNDAPKRRNRCIVRLGIERLEARIALAGNVVATFSDGKLSLTGDIQSNEVDISANGGGVVVTPFIGTRLNGAEVPIAFPSPTNVVKVTLNAGNDLLTSGQESETRLVLPGKFQVDSGIGDDGIDLRETDFGGKIEIKTGKGGDALIFDQSGCQNQTKFDMGDGSDMLVIDSNNTFVGKFEAKMGGGDDAVFVGNSSANGNNEFGNKAKFDGGKGTEDEFNQEDAVPANTYAAGLILQNFETVVPPALPAPVGNEIPGKIGSRPLKLFAQR